MSLSDDIIAACADDKTPLATILRKCVIFAAKLKSSELANWAYKELEGYELDDNLPGYRRLSIPAKGFFVGPFGAQLKDQPLSSFVLDEKHRHFVTDANARQGIAAYETFAAKDPGGKVQAPWPQDLVVLYQNKFYQGYVLNRAWQEIPISAIIEILDTVRTRVLKFMLELNDEVGDLEQIVASTKVEDLAPVVHNVFNTTVLGGTAILGFQTGHVDARTQIVVMQGDTPALLKELHALGLDRDEIGKLHSAIEDDAASGARNIDDKPKVLAWIKEAAKKIGGAAGNITVDIAKATLTSLVSSYLGAPQG